MSFDYTLTDLSTLTVNKSAETSYSGGTLTVTSMAGRQVQSTPGILTPLISLDKYTKYRFSVVGKKTCDSTVFLYIGVPGGETFSVDRDVVLTTSTSTVSYNFSLSADKTYCFGVLISNGSDDDAFEVQQLKLEAVLPDDLTNKFVGINNDQTITGAKTFNNVLVVPSGTTAGRPSSGLTDGLLRFNTTTNGFEGYYSSTEEWGELGGSIDTSDLSLGICRANTVYASDMVVQTLDASDVNAGTVYASGAVTSFSDARVKTDVNTIENALKIVKQLRGVSFIHKENGQRSVGLIAQEVKQVLPEVVHSGGSSEYYSVAYGNVVGVLIEAVKELSDEVDRLKAKNQ